MIRLLSNLLKNRGEGVRVLEEISQRINRHIYIAYGHRQQCSKGRGWGVGGMRDTCNGVKKKKKKKPKQTEKIIYKHGLITEENLY